MARKSHSRAVSALVLAAFALSTPALAADTTRTTTTSSTSTAVGNSATIVVSGGVATVTTKSCTSGVSGFFFQSIRLLFGGTSTSITQSSTCP